MPNRDPGFMFDFLVVQAGQLHQPQNLLQIHLDRIQRCLDDADLGRSHAKMVINLAGHQRAQHGSGRPFLAAGAF